MTELKNTILEKIETGSVTMRPHWYFVLTAAFYTILTLVVTLAAMYILSFIFFILAQTGLMTVSAFGFSGLLFLFTRSPWLLILLVGALLATLAVLVKDFSFSYRRPMLYSLLGIVFFILITSALIHTFAIHNRVQTFSQEHNVPGLTPLYRDVAGTRPSGITPGRIEALEKDGFILTTPEGDRFDVTTSTKTRGLARQTLQIGDIVLVFGEQTGNSIDAKGIRELPEEMPRLRRER